MTLNWRCACPLPVTHVALQQYVWVQLESVSRVVSLFRMSDLSRIPCAVCYSKTETSICNWPALMVDVASC